MTALAPARAPSAGLRTGPLFWLLALAISLFFALAPRGTVPRWALRFPRAWEVPLDDHLSRAMDWLVNRASLGPFTFKEMTRTFAWLMEWPLDLAHSLLVSGFRLGQGSSAESLTAPISWFAILLVTIVLAHRLGGRSLTLLVGGCFFYLALFGQWHSAMITLSSILIAVPFAGVGGLLLGIAAFRSRRFERLLVPILDIMQTVPVFAYLVPILFLFGFGPVAAMIATIIYALPPMVRVTMLALRRVPADIVEFGRMTGCTRRQLLWKVLVPASRPALMVGVNQVIMLSLNMVIIASMIGAGGLGYDVLTSLRRLDIGHGLEAGVAITVLAIALDRLSQAAAVRSERLRHREVGSLSERPWVLPALALLALATMLIGLRFPQISSYPRELEISTASFWGELVRWINIHFFDQLEAFKTFLLLHLLIPVKRFLLAQPWPWVILFLASLGLALGGMRLALAVVGYALFILVTGFWTKAMITVYLCGISVVVAAAIGIPLGIACGLNDRLWQVVQVVIDTLQTLPSFVYLIPVVMLFRVGDFSAMIAIVLYAVAPVIRYTAHGIRRIPPQLVEAGVTSGCTRGQLLRRIRLPLALPEILLGLNQTIMLALSMLVITALVGTRDLGQEVYIALTKADVGQGLVAGLCVAAIAMIADRLIGAGTEHLKKRLGLAS